MGEHMFDTENSNGEHPSKGLDRVAGLERHTEQACFLRLVALTELDSSKAYEYDGVTSSTAFLR